MFQGELIGIYVAEKSAAPLESLARVEAIAGQGLAPDRYCLQQGTYSKAGGTGRQVTLIEVEALEALARDYDLELHPAQSRRNLLTRGVPLNQLVGRRFRVGEVVLEGMRLCEPCGHLEKLTTEGVRAALVHRGGLRAHVISGGDLHVGDAVAPLEA